MTRPGYYPEHDKLSAVHDKSQAIGEFLDCSDYTLCERFDGQWVPVSKGIERILAEWFDVDLKKLEAEKRRMLDGIRNSQSN